MTRYLLAGAAGGALALALWVLWLTAETEEEVAPHQRPPALEARRG